MDGKRLRTVVWPTGQKGTVVIFPGRTEYIEKYGPAANEFANAGLSTVAIDWRGQGLSDRDLPNRKIGHVEKFQDFQKDADAFFAYLEKLNAPKPYYLLAHSMGGCIGLRALTNGLPVEKVVFSAPMWGISLPLHMRIAAWTVTALFNRTKLRNRFSPGAETVSIFETGTFDDNKLTTDKNAFAFMEGHIKNVPALNVTAPSIGWLHGALREMRRLRFRRSPKLPAMTFLGTQERIVAAGPIQKRMKRWKNGTLEIMEGAEHEIMFERKEIRSAFYQKTIAFFTS